MAKRKPVDPGAPKKPATKKPAQKKTAPKPVSAVSRTDASRKIYFFLARIVRQDRPPEDYLDLATDIESASGLPYTQDGLERERNYLTDPDGVRYSCERLANIKLPHGIFNTLRPDGLPSIENAGKKRDIPVKDDDHLAEATHLVCFDRGVVGIEYNHHGPRPNVIAQYLGRKLDHLQYLKFVPLLQEDVLAKLASFDEITLAKISLAPSVAEMAAEADAKPFMAAVTSIGSSGAGRIEIVMRAARGCHLNKGVIHSIFKKAVTWGGVDKLSIKGRQDIGDKIEPFDLLRDQIVVERRMMRGNTKGKAISSVSAIEEIHEAYKVRESDIVAILNRMTEG